MMMNTGVIGYGLTYGIKYSGMLRIVQSVKLLFETCEAELGLFPTLFWHKI
jgi:hypothetical protein